MSEGMERSVGPGTEWIKALKFDNIGHVWWVS